MPKKAFAVLLLLTLCLLLTGSGGENGSGLTPVIMTVGLVLLIGRGVQITRKTRKLMRPRGPIRQRRSFAAPPRDDFLPREASSRGGKIRRELDDGPEVTVYRVGEGTYLEDTEEQEI